MRIYLASSWKNQRAVLDLAQDLEGSGFEVDAFCRSTDKRSSFHWSEFVDDEADLQNHDAISFLSDERVQRAFREDKKWLDWADTVIMMLPCGRSAHMEAGYGKGKGKHLIIYGEFQKGEFDVMYGFADGLFRAGLKGYCDLVGRLSGMWNVSACPRPEPENPACPPEVMDD